MAYTISYFYRFGEFSIDVEQRVLLRGAQPVPLTPKVFDTLLVLVEQHGRIVGKDELMERLWPDSFVEESNLIFNVQQLRKALGDNARKPVYVETVARRGYRFIAAVEECVADEPVVPVKVRTGSATREFRLVTVALTTSILLVVAISVWYLARFKRDQGRLFEVAAKPRLPTLKEEKLTQTGKARHAVISPDGQYVAYTFEAKGQHAIWLRQLATDSGKEIVPLSERLGGLAFSHSGNHLYFIKGPPESFALYRVDLPLGGAPVRVIEKPQGSYSISSDDSQIAFVRYSEDDKQCALMIGNLNVQQERAIAIHDQPDRFNTPAWSPDGKSIAVAVGPSDSGGQQVRVVQFDVATGSEVELSAFKWFHVSRLVWRPNQRGLLVVGNRTLGQPKQLWLLNPRSGEVSAVTEGLTSYTDISLTADATKAVAPQVRSISNIWIGPAGAAQKLTRVTHAVEDFSWTADGRVIYSAYTSLNGNLWIMKPDGTEQKQLTYEGERNSNPAATADGRYILFTSSRSGLLQIWRMDFDGSNATQLTRGSAHTLPGVSPDGKWVFYNSADDWSLWKVSVDGGEPIPLTNSYAVYPAVSPDGKLIACIGQGNKKSRKLLILSPVDGKILHELDLGPLKLSTYRLRWSVDGGSLLFAASRAGGAGIYKQSLTGGPAEKLAEFDEDDIYDFGYSANGQQLAITRGDYQFDVVLLSGLSQ